jgi:hypothetical protein
MGWDWIGLAQDRDQWRALVNKLWTFGFHKMLGSSWVAAQLAASQEGLSFMELVSLRILVVEYKLWSLSLIVYMSLLFLLL